MLKSGYNLLVTTYMFHNKKRATKFGPLVEAG